MRRFLGVFCLILVLLLGSVPAVRRLIPSAQSASQGQGRVQASPAVFSTL